MMKTTLLSTVAALALALGMSVASAQAPGGAERGGATSGTMERGAPAGGMEKGGGAAEDRKSGMHDKSGRTEQSPSKGGQQAQTPAPNKSDGRAEGKATDKSATDKNAQAPAADKGKMSSEKNAPDSSTQRTGDAKQNMPSDKDGKAAQSPSSKSTVGAAPASETRLTTEQRTQIREKVLATGPKETKVNFSLNVGTVVPRTVHVAEVPTVILDIHPEWRGYRYFIVNDRIIIVEREALRIVAVLDV